MLPFEFVVLGRPRTKNANSSKKWELDVEKAARQRWGNCEPATSDLAVSITYLCNTFQPGGQQPDSDNIAKPIVEALKHLVYHDDHIVTDVLCRRRILEGVLQNESSSALLIAYLSQHNDLGRVHTISKHRR